MAADRTDIDALLETWRAGGADRVDPLRFHRIAALHRRAAARSGIARQVLERRVAALAYAYRRQLDHRAAPDADPSMGSTASGASPPGPDVERDDATRRHARTGRPSALGALVEAMAVDGPTAPGDAWRHPQRAPYPELPALDAVRQLWSELRTRSQVRRSLAPPTEDAGPLNSSRLMHRALSLMRDASPDYLRQFLAYADTLSSLETLQDAGVLTGKDSGPTASGKPRTRARPRKRKA